MGATSDASEGTLAGVFAEFLFACTIHKSFHFLLKFNLFYFLFQYRPLPLVPSSSPILS
jgi:hypothetical protein